MKRASSRIGCRAITVWMAVAFAFASIGSLLSPASAVAAEVSASDRADLRTHLEAWRMCHAVRLLHPDWECRPIPEPPPALADLAERIRGLSRLDALAAWKTEMGLPLGDGMRCLIAVSTEVQHLVRARVAGLAEPRRGGGWVDAACDGVVVPEWPAHWPAPRFERPCAHTRDAERRIDGPGLGACIRTLAGSNLAQAAVGPPVKRPNIVVLLIDDQR